MNLKSYILLILFCLPLYVSGQDVTIDTQEMLDSIGPSLVKIYGNLTIALDQSSITDLTPLQNLVEITGSLTIGGNENLRNTEGLSKLTTVGACLCINSNPLLESIELPNLRNAAEILITHCPSLSSIMMNDLEEVSTDFAFMETGITNLNHFASLNKVGRGFIVSENPRLKTIDSFNNLETIGSHLWINENSALGRIDGFSSLRSAENVEIKENMALESIVGLGQLESIGWRLTIDMNASLVEMPSFDLLESVQIVTVSECASLVAIDGFSKIKTLRGIYIEDCSSLVSIPDFNQIESLGGVSIRQNNLLEKIEGFNSLTSTSDYSIIGNNPSLKTIDAFRNLETAWYLSLNDNPELNSVAALKQLRTIQNDFVVHHTGLTDLDFARTLERVGHILYIHDNPDLPDCCGVFEVLQNNAVGLREEIYDNKKRCNSKAEILADCRSNVEDDFSESQFIVFPNPATENIKILTQKNSTDLELNLISMDGKLLTKQSGYELDLSVVPSGIYLIEILDIKTRKSETQLIVIE